MSSTSNPQPSGINPNDILKLFLQISIPFIVKGIFEEIYLVPLVVTGLILMVISWLAFKPRWKRITSMGVVMVVILSLGGYSYFTSRPTFSLSFLSLPYSEADGYYVSDSMIRANGDLAPYTDFTLSPLEVEIVPHYTGRDRFGNVALRVSSLAQTRDYPLWPDFDQHSQSQTVSIPLSDLISLSEIQVNYHDVDSSLAVEGNPYQQASLSFQVIQLSNPGKPFDHSKDLTIKNTPWVQSTRIIWRDGTWMLDYSLKNLGAETKFYCRITTARDLGFVDEDHDFWSGIEVFAYGPDCTPFVLKTGEIYRTSFPLNKESLGREFERGRYFVQIYTYAERGDLTIENTSYESADDMWVIAQDGQVRTFVICNDPGKSCEQSISFPVEKGNIRAFSFDSYSQFQNGNSYLVTYTRSVENRTTNSYHLEYSIDPQKEGWVGFAVAFNELADVSDFDALKFHLVLDDEATPLWIGLVSKDGQQEMRERVLLEDGNYILENSNEQTVVIPLNAFLGIDLESVAEITFAMDSYMLQDANKHELQISSIEFIHQ
jgi:hypothetical protein